MNRTNWHPTWLDFHNSTSWKGMTLLYDSEIIEMEPEEYERTGSVSSYPSISTPSNELDTASTRSLEGLTSGQILPHTKRIGFIFDYTLTALLMMGNLGSGLKMHAVMMYEVGKLSEELMDELLSELDKVSEIAEGEAQRYHDHAIALRQTLRFLRKQAAGDSEMVAGVDLLRSERLASLEMGTRERILHQNYELLLSMAPISNQTEVITSTSPKHFGPAIPELNSIWMRLYLYKIAMDGPDCQLFVRGTRVKTLPNLFRDCSYVKLFTWNNEPSTVPIASVLQVLNETLFDSPVLLQCFGDGSESQEVNVAFPLGEDFPDSRPSSSHGNREEIEDRKTERESIEGEYNKWNMHTHPIVKRIEETLKLQHQCGFLRMLKVKTKKGEVEEVRWVPEDVHFGVPLHDLDLNRQVIQMIHMFIRSYV